MGSPGQGAPAFVRLAAHPIRWRLLSELAASDYRVRELTDRVGAPQNLVSYHLRLLRDERLVTARRSSLHGRDSYYHLDLDRCADALARTGAALHPVLNPVLNPAPLVAGSARRRVLFACTGNSSRSPIAEALLRHRTGGTVEVVSAGSHPKPRIHSHAVRVLREQYDLDITGQHTRHLTEVAARRFDYVVSLCDKVREVCPEFPDQPRLIHWSIADPAAVDDKDSYAAFRRAAAEINTRVRHLLPVLATAPNTASNKRPG